MAETKDKVVTVESLAAVHIHNQNAYMAKINPSGSGTLTMDGVVDAGSLRLGNAILEYDSTDGVLKIVFSTGESGSEE